MPGKERSMLDVKNIDVYYGKVQALFQVSFHVDDGEIVSIIGSNGAGKSTLMKTIMGINTPDKGTIEFLGKRIDHKRTDTIVKEGVVYIPEGREIFPGMTVYDNLRMGAYSCSYTKSQLKQAFDEAFEMFPRLRERQKQLAGSLSGGEQQMLAIARGLLSNPKIIMFDEPSLGLAPVIVEEMFDIIVKINQTRKIPIVLVEQNAYMAMEVSHRTYVLDVGHMKVDGISSVLMDSPEIKAAYLGG